MASRFSCHHLYKITHFNGIIHEFRRNDKLYSLCALDIQERFWRFRRFFCTALKPVLVGIILLALWLITVGCEPDLHGISGNPTIKTSTPSSDISPSTPVRAISPSPTAKVTPTISLDISADQLRGKLIQFWHPWTGPLGKTVESLVQEFNLSNPWGIMVIPSAYSSYDGLSDAIETGQGVSEAPQLTVGLTHQIFRWDAARGLVDMRPYVADPEWGLTSAEQADFFPLFWDQDEEDGRRLGIPAFRSAQVLFYNKSWAEELGFQLPPATSDQFHQQACAAYQANRDDDASMNDGTGGWIISADNLTLYSWILAFGGDSLRSTTPQAGKSNYQFNTPETEQALTFLKKLYDAGCAWQSQNQVPDEPFAGRQGLFASGGILDIPYMAEAFKAAGSQDHWTALPFPSPISEPAITVSGPSFVIPQSSPEDQLAAWLFIRWVSLPENSARLAESIGAIPARSSAIDQMKAFSERYPQWAETVELLQFGQVEPANASWGQVRRALSDAATQLFRSYFTIEQIPAMLDYLDAFAAELELGPDLDVVFATSTGAPKPGARPTRTPKPTPMASATFLPSATPASAR